MFANFATAISTSTAVTLALFYIMNMLIHIQPQACCGAKGPRQAHMAPYTASGNTRGNH